MAVEHYETCPAAALQSSSHHKKNGPIAVELAAEQHHVVTDRQHGVGLKRKVVIGIVVGLKALFGVVRVSGVDKGQTPDKWAIGSPL